jgi:hypothetical protein
MGVHLVKVQAAVRDLHRRKDTAGARAMFVQMSNLVKQIDRFKQLHHICTSMLDRVKEQAVMHTTSVVLQQFVSVHEDLIKDCNLDKLVSQYQDLQENVDGIRTNFDDIAHYASSVDPNEPDWDDELKNWLAEDEVIVQPHQVTAPEVEMITAKPSVKQVAAVGPSVTDITSTFPEVPRPAEYRGRSPPPLPNPNQFPAAVAAEAAAAPEAVAAAEATIARAAIDIPVQLKAVESTLSASAATFPEVPTSMTATHAVQDLRGLFGDNVVKKEKFLATD